MSKFFCLTSKKSFDVKSFCDVNSVFNVESFFWTSRTYLAPKMFLTSSICLTSKKVSTSTFFLRSKMLLTLKMFLTSKLFVDVQTFVMSKTFFNVKKFFGVKTLIDVTNLFLSRIFLTSNTLLTSKMLFTSKKFLTSHICLTSKKVLIITEKPSHTQKFQGIWASCSRNKPGLGQLMRLRAFPCAKKAETDQKSDQDEEGWYAVGGATMSDAKMLQSLIASIQDSPGKPLRPDHSGFIKGIGFSSRNQCLLKPTKHVARSPLLQKFTKRMLGHKTAQKVPILSSLCFLSFLGFKKKLLDGQRWADDARAFD